MDLVLTATQNFKRLDKFLTLQFPQFSRTKLQLWIKQGNVYCNNYVVTNISEKVQVGDSFSILLKKDLTTSHSSSTNIPIDVIYEDESLIIVNKQANLVTHPGRGNTHNTLVNGLIYKYGTHNLSQSNYRPGIVHRLDKDTSGLLIVAKNDHVHLLLSKMISERLIVREYLAIVHGIIFPNKGLISTFISPHSRNKKIMCVNSRKGKKALTEYTTFKISEDNSNSIIYCKLLTGRTHQIRVHLAYKGTPIIGDNTYTLKKYSNNNLINRQALHAYKISFTHPLKNKYIEVAAPLPDDIKQLIEKIKWID